ncbi:MAG: repeat protein [Bryobacterales bacterium]|nr:repeat protein [Bryobacterales bacterium]
MTSLFHNETKPEPNVTPQAAGLWAAGIGAFLVFVISFIQISNSKSSTAAIGFLFLPFIAAFAAVPCFVTGWCLGYALTWWRSPVRRKRITAVAASTVPLTAGLWILHTVSFGFGTMQEVHRIEYLDAGQLRRVLDDRGLASNKFVLGAIAQNPRADSWTLHRIATTRLPELHEPMGSAFDVLGKNMRGLAVMRLVAKHRHTAAEDLDKLAQSPNEDVLSDVVGNPKLSTGTVRRLAERGGQWVELGVALNPAAPTDLLARLALSSNEFTRAAVAGNPGTPDEVLRGLSVDQSWNVRGHVGLNRATPPEVLETLRNDEDERVRRYAGRR